MEVRIAIVHRECHGGFRADSALGHPIQKLGEGQNPSVLPSQISELGSQCRRGMPLDVRLTALSEAMKGENHCARRHNPTPKRSGDIIGKRSNGEGLETRTQVWGRGLRADAPCK